MPYIKKYLIMSGILIVLLLFSCCGSNDLAQENGDGRITVYTSFYTMYDFTVKISGDKANVINMVPSGTEPHDWEPSPRDVAGLAGADLFVYNGAGMENWAEKVISSINNPSLIVVETSKNINLKGIPMGKTMTVLRRKMKILFIYMIIWNMILMYGWIR